MTVHGTREQPVELAAGSHQPKDVDTRSSFVVPLDHGSPHAGNVITSSKEDRATGTQRQANPQGTPERWEGARIWMTRASRS